MRLPVRGATPPDPGDRRDLSNTFRQLSYPNLTPSRFLLLLSRIGERNSDGNIGAMILGLRDEETFALLNLLVDAIEGDRYPMSPRIRLLREILAKCGEVGGLPPELAQKLRRYTPLESVGLLCEWLKIDNKCVCALTRRSQKDRTGWVRINKLADQWLPKPRILHPWPNRRFAVKHPRWEPDAGMPHWPVASARRPTLVWHRTCRIRWRGL